MFSYCCFSVVKVVDENACMQELEVHGYFSFKPLFTLLYIFLAVSFNPIYLYIFALQFLTIASCVKEFALFYLLILKAPIVGRIQDLSIRFYIEYSLSFTSIIFIWFCRYLNHSRMTSVLESKIIGVGTLLYDMVFAVLIRNLIDRNN